MKTTRKLFSILLAAALLLSTVSAGLSVSADASDSGAGSVDIIVPETIYLKPGTNTAQYYLSGAPTGSQPAPNKSAYGLYNFSLSEQASSISVALSMNDSALQNAALSTTSVTNTGVMTGMVSNLVFPGSDSGMLKWTFTYVINGTSYTSAAYTYVYAPYLGQTGCMSSDTFKTTIGNEPKLAAYAFLTGIHSTAGGPYRSAFTDTQSAQTLSPLMENWSDGSVPNVHVPAADNYAILSDAETYFPTDTSGGVTNMTSSRTRNAETSREYGSVNGYGVLTVDKSRYASSGFNTIPNFAAGWMIFGAKSCTSKHYLNSFRMSDSGTSTCSFAGNVDFVDDQTQQSFYPYVSAEEIPAQSTNYSVEAVFTMQRSSSSTVNISYLFGLHLIVVDKETLRSRIHAALNVNPQPSDFAGNGYTAYQEALYTAFYVLGKPDVTQLQIDDASAALSASINSIQHGSDDPVSAFSITVPETIYLESGTNTAQYYIAGAANGSDPSASKATSGVYSLCLDQTASDIDVTVTSSADPSVTVFSASAQNAAALSGTVSDLVMPTTGSDLLTWTFTYTIDETVYTSKAYTFVYAPFLGQTGCMHSFTYKTVIGNEPKLAVYAFLMGIHSTNGGPYRSAFTGTSGLTMSPLVAGWNSSNVPAASADDDCHLLNADTYFPTDSTGGVTYMMSDRDRNGDTSGHDYGSTDGYGVLTVDWSRYHDMTFAILPNFAAGWMVFGCISSDELHELNSFTATDNSETLTFASNVNYVNGQTSQAFAPYTSLNSIPSTSTDYTVTANYRMRRSSSSTVTMTDTFGLHLIIVNKSDLRTAVNDAITRNLQPSDCSSSLFNAFENALRYASLILGKPDATAEEIETAENTLEYMTAHIEDHPDHTLQTAVIEETCTTGGAITYTCPQCGDVGHTDLTPALGHDFTAKITTQPTCTTDGLQQDVCSRCAQVFSSTVIPALGHAYDDGVVTTEPTCVEDGIKTFTCTLCGHSYTETVPALGHSYDCEYVPPTCTQESYYIYTCSRCNDVVYGIGPDNDALGHTYDDGVVTTEPTCEEDGVKTFTCTRCSQTYTEVIPATGEHIYDEGVITTEATCTENGCILYTCTLCGSTYTETVENLGHDFDDTIEENVTIVPATTTETGTKTVKCSRCSEIQVSELPVLPDPDQMPIFIVSDGSAHPGDTVQVTVCIQNNSGLTAAALNLHYDPAVLTLTNAVENSLFPSGTFVFGSDYSAEPFIVLYEDGLSTVNHTENGAFLTFTFTVKEDAPLGETTVYVTYEEESTFDFDLQNVAFLTQEGHVSVTERIAGDATGDGSLNLKDIVTIRRYLAHWEGVVVDESSADVNGDGVVSLEDVALLMRFLAGWSGVELI